MVMYSLMNYFVVPLSQSPKQKHKMTLESYVRIRARVRVHLSVCIYMLHSNQLRHWIVYKFMFEKCEIKHLIEGEMSHDNKPFEPFEFVECGLFIIMAPRIFSLSFYFNRHPSRLIMIIPERIYFTLCSGGIYSASFWTSYMVWIRMHVESVSRFDIQKICWKSYLIFSNSVLKWMWTRWSGIKKVEHIKNQEK